MKKAKRNARRGSETTLKTPPTEERIRQRAYELHQARGGIPGHDLDDWLQAERELKTDMSQLPEADPAEPDKPLAPQD